MRYIQEVQRLNRKGWLISTICNAALVITAYAALSGCAAVGNPDGGAYDETPPRITGSHPRNGATGVTNRKVTIDFNEFIKLENANEKVVISPPQTEQPEIKVTGKRIQVELLDSLRPNQTYTIDFADGIVDNNEGNPLGNYCFSFGTGQTIDTLEVSGYVLNADNLEPIKGMTVGIHSDLSDTAFMAKPFDRVSRSDADGHFTVRGIAPGKYRIYAVMDMDQTFSYSQRNEKIAWMDSVIIPTSELRYREDTLFTDDGQVDTTKIVPYIQYLPNDITLLAFTPTPIIQYMNLAERPSHEKFSLQFSLPLDSMPVIHGLNFDESNDFILQHSTRFDTLTFWMKDTTVFYQDTLSMSITYMASDTTGMLVSTTDTLNLVTKRSRAKIVEDEERRAQEEKKELDKQIKRLERAGDSLAIAELLKPKVKHLKYNLTTGSSLSIYKQIGLSFEEPVTFLTDTAIHIYQKVDTLWNAIPFEVEHDSINILQYRIYAEWKPEQTFKIEIDSASIMGLYGLHNEPISGTLKFNALNQYSTLTVNVAAAKPGYTVRLHDSKGKIVRSGKLNQGSVDFFLLSPSTYYISMYDDVNGNGKWDTGDYEQKKQPESVWYIPRSWQLKQDWTHETDLWYIEEYPLYEQKPAELSSSKKEKKSTNIHQKNVERLEKKASQIESEKEKKERKRKERRERKEQNRLKYESLRSQGKA